MRRNGFNEARDPILKPLETIECRDAILTPDGEAPGWPSTDVVIGNPPFLGSRKIRSELGDYVAETLPRLYDGMIDGKPDLVCYWFAKAGKLVADGKVSRTGLVATNSIRGGTNRTVLDSIVKFGYIFDAWSDESWVIDGAAVRVSLICFGPQTATLPVTPERRKHPANQRESHRAEVRSHLRHDTGKKRRRSLSGKHQAWLVRHLGGPRTRLATAPGEPARETEFRRTKASGERNGPNSPCFGKVDRRFRCINDRRGSRALRGPFRPRATSCKGCPAEDQRGRQSRILVPALETPGRKCGRRSPSCAGISRPPTVSKHRLFTWLDTGICPDHQLIVIARDDDTTLRHTPQPVPRGLVATAGYQPGRPATLHPDHDLRDLSVPGRPFSRHPRGRVRGQPAGNRNRKAQRGAWSSFVTGG